MKVHLIDATWELFRAHYGAPPARAPDGREVGATEGLLRSLCSLLAQPDVTHLACGFDHVIESFRNGLFPGYKTGAGVPEDLLAQFGLAEQAVLALGVVVWPMLEFEADDALATAAARFARDPGVEQVVVCSPDKDFAQCVQGSRIVTFDRQRRLLRDEAGVVAKFGVAPASMPDWLGLVGDDADGIPGLPGFGPKTAATLLARYGTLDAVPDDAAAWDVAVRGAPGLAATLRERREDARLYRLLATLRRDVPLGESLEDLRWRGPRPELGDRLAELGEGELRVPPVKGYQERP